MKKSKWGTLIGSVELKDGNMMYTYRNGNMVYFIINDEIDQSFHVDDFMDALADITDESEV